jgi:hypothetical protein
MWKMNEITNYQELKKTITMLEEKQSLAYANLKNDLVTELKSLSPTYMVKNTLQALSPKLNLNGGILSTAMGMLMGLISKKIYERISMSPLKRMIGIFLLIVTTHLISKNPQKFQMVLEAIIQKIKRLKEAIFQTLQQK